MTSPASLIHRIGAWRRKCAVIATLAIALSVLGWLLDARQFCQSYVVAFCFWIGLPLGATALVMLHNLTGGKWGIVASSAWRPSMKIVAIFPIFFLPIAFGMAYIYPWAGLTGHDDTWQRTMYLTQPGFLMRSAVYFAVWIGLALLTLKLRSTTTSPPDGTARGLSAVGLLLYGMTVSFAAVDWLMSIEPDWYSTIYGMSFAVGQALSALAFAIIVIVVTEELKENSAPLHQPLHDLGNLLLAFVMLWAYLAFSQYLIIWSGNLPSEISWYVKRSSPGWSMLAAIVMAFHFFVPFLLLLSTRVKRNARWLMGVAVGILLFRLLDLFWITAPAFSTSGFQLHWLDVVLPITLGLVWLTLFVQLYERSLIRTSGVGDPA